MSEVGSFSQCLMEGDAEALARAKGLRRKALTASLGIEAMLVAAMLLVPLITQGVLPKTYNVTPLPPYSAPHEASLPHSHVGPPPRGESRPPIALTPIYQPPRVPIHVDNSPSNQPPSVGETSEPGVTGIPGATWPGMPFTTGDHPASPPPPMTERHEPVRKVHIAVMEAALIHRVDPVYPMIARTSHTTGEVKLRATISTDGTIKDWQVLSGNPIFFRDTIAAIRQWRYKPTLLNGEPVEVETLITVRFVMD